MATSKHFPVQKYTPSNDTDDFNYNETYYNSVSSFKSYHSNKNRSSVTSATPYTDLFENVNSSSVTPNNKSQDKSKEHSTATNNNQEPTIDNTVVSAYKGSKPPLPTHKPRPLKNSKSRQIVSSAHKPQNTENQEPRKFGIENLQSISKQLQNENKELRRHRNSKGQEEISLVITGGFTSENKEIPHNNLKEPGISSREESCLILQSSQNVTETGCQSYMSRRRLPKVPLPLSGAQSQKLPIVSTDNEQKASTLDNTREVATINVEAAKHINYMHEIEVNHGVISDSESVPKCLTHKSSNSPGPKVLRRSRENRKKDKNRSLSVGGVPKDIPETKINMSDKIKSVNKAEVTDLNGRKKESSATGDFIESDTSSHQDISQTSGEHDTNESSQGVNYNIRGTSLRLKGNSSNCPGNLPELHHIHLNDACDLPLQDIISNEFMPENHSKHVEDESQLENEDNQDDYSIVDALNDIVQNASTELSSKLPEKSFFKFDNAVIQQLTDSVMEKNSDRNYDEIEITDESVIGERIHSDEEELNFNNMMSKQSSKSTFKRDRFKIEGKSYNGNSPDENEKNKSSAKSLDNEIVYHSMTTDNHVSHMESIPRIIPQKIKVERSPSYRKKVMARAKSRYKKSSMLKECSCTRNEYGDIAMCQFCESYESRKRRSKSSLGLESVGLSKDGDELSEGEKHQVSAYSEISCPRRAFTPGLPPSSSSKSPRPLRKLQISSRVDVLMSSDLFKKHLHKHENLLHKHTLLRQTGMRKAVSNLDLSDGYLIDSDSQCDTESITSETNFEKEISAKDDILNQSQDWTVTNKDARRHSLTGDSDSSIENLHKHKKKHFRTLPTSVGRPRMPIPSFTQPNFRGSKSRTNIPTFKEFKTMQELSNSSEALNKTASESETAEKEEDLSCLSRFDNVEDCYDVNRANKTNETRFEKQEEIVKVDNTEELIPIHLAAIKESLSKENLVAEEFDNNLCTSQPEKYEVVVTNNERELVRPKGKSRNTSGEVLSNRMKDSNEAVVKDKDNVEGHESVRRQKSTPDMKPQKQHRKPKLKSRTLSRLDMETECLSDTASGNIDSISSLGGGRKPGAKRPRSLISKKSSLVSLIQESEKKQNLDNVDSSSEKSTKSRPKLKVGHNVNRSKSDSKYELERGKDGDAGSKHYRNLLLEKGKNTVTFDLDDASQCSTFDIGESETSTSMLESLSDSMRSELLNDQDETDNLLEVQDIDIAADDNCLTQPFKEELVSQVLRSTSDACEITQEAARKRRERKERPYKSDPFSGTEIIPASRRCVLREEKAKLRQHMDFANSSKEEILTFLDGVSHNDLANCDSFPSLEELNEDDEQLRIMSEGVTETTRKIRKHHSNVSSLSTDSGVIGQDGSHDSQQSSPSNTLLHSQSDQTMSSWQNINKKRSLSASCTELTKQETQDCTECCPEDMIDVNRSQVCTKCSSRRRERKEIIQEIMDTEITYGRDLNILKEEFYKPMMKAGLLSKEQLDAIFLNLDELLHVNKHFISKLKSAVHSASQNNDNDLEEVMIGSLFLESSTMFLTFENYCVNQAQAPVLLEQLEREKELLRIFLQVSQNDNQQLRRMHLKSFLMVPVQRIMKYPLLLNRLHKTTASNHLDKNSLKEAKEKIEDILGHINAKARTVSFRQRKPSQKSSQHCSVTEKIEVSRVALETLQWNRKDVCDVITSQLQITQPVDHLWAIKKCKNYKFTTVYGVLLTLMQPSNEKPNDNDVNNIKNANNNNNNNNFDNIAPRVHSAAVVFIKEKSGRYQVMREPFMLEKCVVSQDPEFPEVFEILEWSKEAFLIKAESVQETKLWVQNLRQQMNNLGVWRKRRNALPNILLNHHS